MNEKLLEELNQFLSYARREGVVDDETANKLENFAYRYVENII
jgi:hypothetical protein